MSLNTDKLLIICTEINVYLNNYSSEDSQIVLDFLIKNSRLLAKIIDVKFRGFDICFEKLSSKNIHLEEIQEYLSDLKKKSQQHYFKLHIQAIKEKQKREKEIDLELRGLWLSKLHNRQKAKIMQDEIKKNERLIKEHKQLIREEKQNKQRHEKELITIDFRQKFLYQMKQFQLKTGKKLLYHLLSNYSIVDELINKNYMGLKTVFKIKTKKDILNVTELLRDLNSFYVLGPINTQNSIDKQIEDLLSPLDDTYFLKGGKKRKNVKNFTRDNKEYSLLEQIPLVYATYEFQQQYIKRNKYIDTSINKLFYNNKVNYEKKEEKKESKFSISRIKYVQKNLGKEFQRLETFESSLYEYEYSVPLERDLKLNSIFLELNLNLPRYELEKIFLDFLELYQVNKFKEPTSKQYSAKIKKLVDMLFIYDGKKLGLSNEEIVNKLWELDVNKSDSKDLGSIKTMSKTTFQKYVKIMQNIIDKKGYMEIVNGKKSIFEIL